ncbi:LysR substrate-binding domain-containing protein [Streptomyces sp. NPDC102360]|uniref:LysR substrate-binding domain-containing protein n=1 Tax=Streptomyces sp. NPDC102360 TaxID=3366160 RepID=UPI0037F20625
MAPSSTRPVDVGIVRDAERRDDMDLCLLASERLVAVAPTGHPAAGSGRVAVRALAADPLILFPRSAGSEAFDLNTKPLRNAGIDVNVAQEFLAASESRTGAVGG